MTTSAILIYIQVQPFVFDVYFGFFKCKEGNLASVVYSVFSMVVVKQPSANQSILILIFKRVMYLY